MLGIKLNLKIKKLNKIKLRKKLTKLEQNSFTLTNNLKKLIVGSALGDLLIRKLPRGKIAHLRFRQGLIHESYLNHLYDLFQDYCNSGPKKQEHLNKNTNKSSSTLYFQTYSLPCFN
jgi:hypothetical protein